jgi:fluoroacetyl-CoA thioesterase
MPGQGYASGCGTIRAVARERPAVGEEATMEVTVSEDMLVDIFGRRIHPVYSTVSMVKHVEEASRLLIEPHLRVGEDGTGYSVFIVHQGPARVGERLRVVARAIRVDDRECESEVEVVGPAGRVGKGTVVQRYITSGQLG